MSLKAAFETPERKRAHVRALFATIAARYDLITTVLSYGLDARWKANLVSLAEVRKGERTLDLACGTGDIAFAVAARGARCVGLDITMGMLEIAASKRRLRESKRRPQEDVSHPVELLCGDMTYLPFQSAAFDLVTTGYGLRNVPDLPAAIDEIGRVLKPGGRLLSLDFNRPRSAALRASYLAYLTAVGSALGWILHRDPDTYRYIPESIARYPGADAVAQMLRVRGFINVRVRPVLFGLMALHLAERAR